MKTALACCFALLALAPVQAQVFRPEALNGAVLGGIAGAVIGNNSGDLHHNAWKGAAIGAGAGLLLGEAVGNANASARATQVNAPYATSGGYVYQGEPAVRVGIGVGYRGGYGYYGNRHYGYYEPRYRFGYGAGYGRGYYYYPSYSYYDGYGYGYPYYSDYGYYGTGGSAAANGLLLGALAGGIIGNNSGDFRHNGWRGAAWGAGAGLLAGAIIDANRRPVVASAPVVVQQAPVAQGQVQATPPAQAQPVTIINNYYNSSTPMSSANSLFGR
jgi:hypothetical protein